MQGFSIPDYKVCQDANHVYIDVSCQGVTSADGTANIAVEGRIFGFHVEPYYLPLVLPGTVTRPHSAQELVRTIAQDAASSSSHCQASQFRVTLTKAQQGEHFEGLDQLQPQLLPEDQLKQALADAELQKGFFQPSGSGASMGAGAAQEDEWTNEAAKALLQQALRNQRLTTVNEDDGEAAITTPAAPSRTKGQNSEGKRFGFGFRSSFQGSLIPAGCVDTGNVLEVSDPDSTEPAKREQVALAFEEQRWDEGIYMADFLDIDGELAHLLRFQPCIPLGSSSNTATWDASTDIEALALIVQLLFALSYDDRTNQDEPTVESGWTIAKLSRSLAASTLPQTASTPLPSPGSVVASTLIGCMRRALTVPLYRHWELAVMCIDDALRRIEAGSAYVVECLDQIATRMEEGQDAILCRLSEVWIAPLLAQPPSQTQLDQLSRAIRTVIHQGNAISKEAVGGESWHLQVLQQAAKQALQDGQGEFV
ncbi:hypothetical protein NDA13_005706 [Ustilago tritici]|nr:hypothetical protein NDA13_005706 [Ustilago tritici]